MQAGEDLPECAGERAVGTGEVHVERGLRTPGRERQRQEVRAHVRHLAAEACSRLVKIKGIAFKQFVFASLRLIRRDFAAKCQNNICGDLRP